MYLNFGFVPIQADMCDLHFDTCYLLSVIGEHSESSRSALCNNGSLEALLDLMQRLIQPEDDTMIQAILRLRRAVDKSMHALCFIPEAYSVSASTPKPSVRYGVDHNIVGKALKRESVTEALRHSDQDIRSRVLRFLAKLLSSRENACQLGGSAITPLVDMMNAWSDRRSAGIPEEITVQKCDSTAVGLDAEMVHCCECLVALARADAECCAAVGTPETIKGLISIFGAGPITTEDFLLDNTEPKCYVGCPRDWSWTALKSFDHTSMETVERCIRGVAASVLMAIAEGGSRWSNLSGTDDPDINPTKTAALSIAELASSTCLNILSVDVDFEDEGFFWGSFRKEHLVDAQMKLDMLNLFRAIADMDGGKEKLLEAAQQHTNKKYLKCPATPTFKAYDFVSYRDDALDNAAVYIRSLAGIVSILFYPSTQDEALISSFRAIRALCSDDKITAGSQGVIVDTLAYVAISMGILIPLASLQEALRDVCDNTVSLELENLTLYLIERAQARETFWRTEVQTEGENLCCHNDDDEASIPESLNGQQDLSQSDYASVRKKEGDPNLGPSREQWKHILNVPFDDVRNKQRNLTPLLAAQIGGVGVVVKALLKAGVNPNVADGDGVTPLMHALRQGSEKGVQNILEAGGNVDAIDNIGNSVIKLAIVAPFPGQIESIFENRNTWSNNCPTEASSNKFGVRFVARFDKEVINNTNFSSAKFDVEVIGDNAEFFNKLLIAGADPNISDDDGNFPLHWAILGISVRFIMKGIHVKLVLPALATGYCSVSLGSSIGKPLYSRLVSAGADVNVCNKDGATPLHLAIKMGCLEAALDLLNVGAHPNIKDACGRTALHLSCAQSPFIANGPSFYEKLIERILEEGCGRSFLQGKYLDKRKGKTKTEKAALAVEEAMMRSLQEAKMPSVVTTYPASHLMLVSEADMFGVSPLEYACGAEALMTQKQSAKEEERATTINLLLKHPEPMFPKEILNKCLYLSLASLGELSEDRRLDIIKVLIEAGADIEASIFDNHLGFDVTPLQYATFKSFTIIARYFMDKGATVLRGHNVSPLHLACYIPSSASLVKDFFSLGSVSCCADSKYISGTPIQVAVLGNNEEALTSLLGFEGVEIDHTLLQYACSLPTLGRADIVNVIVDHIGAKAIMFPDQQGKTSLGLAVESNCPGNVKALLSKLSDFMPVMECRIFVQDILRAAETINIKLFEMSDFSNPKMFSMDPCLKASNEIVHSLLDFLLTCVGTSQITHHSRFLVLGTLILPSSMHLAALSEAKKRTDDIVVELHSSRTCQQNADEDEAKKRRLPRRKGRKKVHKS